LEFDFLRDHLIIDTPEEFAFFKKFHKMGIIPSNLLL